MKLIIDIDKDYYELIKADVKSGNDYKPCVLIANGKQIPKGEWIEYKEDNEIRYYCSNCLITKGQAVNCFCASCGADMRGEDK